MMLSIFKFLSIIIVPVYCQDFSIRLIGGPSAYKGRLEIHYSGQWGTVCNDEWGESDAEVVCRELGLGPPVTYLISDGFDGLDTQSILLDEVQCVGTESKLSKCRHDTIGSHNCGHNEDVSLECTPEPVVVDKYAVRLADGVHKNVGRLEVYYDDQWTQVCTSQWTDVNSDVVCHQLGYLRKDQWVSGYEIKSSSKPFLLNFICSGNEQKLEECNRKNITNAACSDAVQIQCTNQDNYYQGDVQLAGQFDFHDQSNEGILEIYWHGTLGKMCSTFWTEDESNVVCKELGYDKGKLEDAFHYDTISVSNLPMHQVQFNCYGGESNMTYCRIDDHTFGCNQFDIVALKCEYGPLLSGGEIAGVVLGCIAGTVVLFMLFCYCRSKKPYRKWKCPECPKCPRYHRASTRSDEPNDPPEELETRQPYQARIDPPFNFSVDPPYQVAGDVQPSAPPPAAPGDLPPSYNCVMDDPTRYKATEDAPPLETPPPDYSSYQSPIKEPPPETII